MKTYDIGDRIIINNYNSLTDENGFELDLYDYDKILNNDKFIIISINNNFKYYKSSVDVIVQDIILFNSRLKIKYRCNKHDLACIN